MYTCFRCGICKGYAIYYPVYEEGEAEDKSHFDKDAIVLDINTEKMADYDERLFGTYKLPDCSSGYINKSDNFSVNYIFGMNHITGSFVDGKWDIKKRNIEKDYSDYSCDYCIEGGDSTLWGRKLVGNYCKMIVFDQSGKILYRIDMKKWQRKNGYSKSKLNEVIPLSDEECILVFEEDGKEISCQLDLSTEAVIRKYETGLHGIPAGDYLCYLEGNRLNVYNYKNEGKKMSVNIENLWEGYICRDLVYYNKSAMDFLGVCNPYSDATICTNDNKVYISLCTGVFEWTVGEDCIYKVLDGEKTKYFNKMNGIMQVGKNGVVYILGNFGWEDEDWDPSQFLVMTPVTN